MRTAVLLVGPDAAARAAALDDGPVDVLAADSDMAARAYLAGTAFDRVVCLGPSEAAGTARTLGIDVVSLPADSASDAIGRVLGLAPPDPARPSAPLPPADGGEAARHVQALRAEIDRVAHDLNNPVAVILGNAQLARALAPDLPDDVAAALADIEDAAGVIAERAKQLGALRRGADRALVALGHER